MRQIGILTILCTCLILMSCSAGNKIMCMGNPHSDLAQLLEKEGYHLQYCASVSEVLEKAPKRSGVLLLNTTYPEQGIVLTTNDLDVIKTKSLRVLVEFPQQLGENVCVKTNTMELERVVACDSLTPQLPKMSLMDFHSCVVKKMKDTPDSTYIVVAKVAGFDKAVYGLDNTPTLPLLYQENENIMVAATNISNFSVSRYMPEHRVQSVFEYILSWLLQKESVKLSSWISYVKPAYSADAKLPKDAARESIAKGIEWYYNGHFLVHPSWKKEWVDKYMGDGLMPVGPELPAESPDGDGTLGVLEGHMSGIYHDGKQRYRYWMRDDVQGESSYAFAAAGDLLAKDDYLKVSSNLLNYSFREYRDSVRNNPKSPSYGLLGWAYTHKNTYYGDDNARSILGSLGASAILNDTSWDKQIVECIVGNFRTTGKNGFRGGNILDADLQKNGWRHYFHSDLVNLHPHFESWNWACYLWLYTQTKYQPLLDRVKKGVELMMKGYPNDWNWTNGIQQERARMILPLAWLYRVEPTEQHQQWLQFITEELLKNQVACGGIREELGNEAKSMFGCTPSNDAYGRTEASLIFKNGDPVADMLYTTNFAFVGLCEAAMATQNPEYLKAVNQMRDFLIRIQVRSDKFKNVDGAWFRAFNYQDWNYWASNADAGWGAWSTLTGWIQSWIIGTQYLIEKNTSLWDLAAKKDVSAIAGNVIEEMITNNQY